MKISPLARLVLVCATLLSPLPALAQFSQQGPKLVATDAVGDPSLGEYAFLSADGNTAIVGGPNDNDSVGAAWVWTRSGGVWSQQGPKLVGSGSAGPAQQGFSVALSADGNTAIVGGIGDNNDVGAAWVWTRSGGVWSQQGAKLVGSSVSGSSQQGFSVALSADANTAIVGGIGDSSNLGAAWVFTRSAGVWSQQSKLVGVGAVGPALQGQYVALSADGNTALVGGPTDNNLAGATWAWTRSGGVWIQQGDKLVGTGTTGVGAEQGFSVALSADGNLALIGGVGDDNSHGAAWVFTKSAGFWSQSSPKLVGSGAVGASNQGFSVSLSADGNVAMVGGPTDNNDAGASWLWARNGVNWTQAGPKLVGSGASADAQQGFSVSLSSNGGTALSAGPGDDLAGGAAWVFVAPDLTIMKSHSGVFHQGDTGDAFTITVTNSGSAPTSGTVTVSDTLLTGFTPTGPIGSAGGWICSIIGQTLTCTRSDVLAAGGSYPAITLTVNVANDAPASQSNTATVSGGGEANTANDSANDVVTIGPPSPPAAPTGVTAVAVSDTQINVTWAVVPGATYQIDRKGAGGTFSQIGTSVTNSFSDPGVTVNSAYLYRVRAVNGAGPSPSSAFDLATTVIFVDNPLTPGIPLKAIHLSQLRTAVNAVRLLAGLTAASFTGAATAGTSIIAVQTTELRSSLDPARAALGLSTGGYTDPSLTGVNIKAVHFQELRNRVQ